MQLTEQYSNALGRSNTADTGLALAAGMIRQVSRFAGYGGNILVGGLYVRDALGDDDGHVSGSGLSRI